MKQNQQFTVGLVVAAVALGTYMYFVESKKEAPTDTKDVEVWSLSDNQARDLKTLTLTADGKTATYTRNGDDWKVSTDPTRSVDTTSFNTSFNYLKALTAMRKVEDKPSDLGKYGLKAPTTVVSWGDANTKYKLEVGDKTPTNDGYYTHVLKDDGIYTIAAYKVDAWKTLVSKPPLVALPSPSPTAAPVATGAAPVSGAAVPTTKPFAIVTAKPLATVKPAPAGTAKPAATPAPTATPHPAATATPAASASKH